MIVVSRVFPDGARQSIAGLRCARCATGSGVRSIAKGIGLYVAVYSVSLLSACTGLPAGVHPVKDFELSRYLGKWYEIARLDHSFERGLENVSADYTLRGDGGVRVVNRGFSKTDKQWKEAVGKAYFVGKSDEGHLKVSFFGPFYASYVVFELDHESYDYAFVSGYDKSYLWLLSRTPTVEDSLMKRFRKTAGDLGFDAEELIVVDQAGVEQAPQSLKRTMERLAALAAAR